MPIVEEFHAGLTGEKLKASMVQVDPTRSQDALHGVDKSPLSRFASEATVGPYNGELAAKEVDYFLSNPNMVTIVGCGRDEEKRGNLGPNLAYWQQSTHEAGNSLFVDANSKDHSLKLAHSMGVEAVRRSDVFPAWFDIRRFSEVLALPRNVLEGKEDPRFPPLRKGTDMLVARAKIMKDYAEGKAPAYILYTDTDLKSIPGGPAEQKLRQIDPDLVYLPLQLAARGTLDLTQKRNDGMNQWAVYTGSENRNNETIFGIHNQLAADIVSPYLDPEQRAIAEALLVTPSIIVHPLTGELIVATPAELQVMGATGQCVEIARILSLAGNQYEALGTINPNQMTNAKSLIGNVRRGVQQRVDEPQIDEKEWWMIGGVIPQFAAVVTRYAIQERKLPHDFDLLDYTRVNNWLSQLTYSSRLNNRTQTREIDRYPMERAIPPISLLYKEEILKL